MREDAVDPGFGNPGLESGIPSGFKSSRKEVGPAAGRGPESSVEPTTPVSPRRQSLGEMMVVDTSAVLSILFDEALADWALRPAFRNVHLHRLYQHT